VARIITKPGVETKQKYHYPEKHSKKMKKKPGERLPTVGVVPNSSNTCLRVQSLPSTWLGEPSPVMTAMFSSPTSPPPGVVSKFRKPPGGCFGSTTGKLCCVESTGG